MSAVTRVLVLCLGGLLVSPTLAERPTGSDSTAALQASIRSDIEYLASDELQGRDVSNQSIHQAAEYIGDRLTKLGLDTSAFDGKPFQAVEIPLGARAGSAEHNFIAVRFTGPEADADQPPNQATQSPIQAKLGDGMNPLAIGRQQGEFQGRVAFVGYGITAPKIGYDDYAGLDVKGATVIVIRKEPGMGDPQSPFDGVKTTRHAFFATKIQNAVKHGAAGVMFVNDPASILQSVQNERSKIAQEQQRKKRIQTAIDELPAGAKNSRKSFQQKLANADRMIASIEGGLTRAQRGLLDVAEAGGSPIKNAIPVMSIARDIADQMISQSSGRSLKTLEQAIDQSMKPSSFVLPDVTASWQIELEPASATSSNVIGVLPGRGPLAEQTVVIGAHYDHVGLGGFGSLAPGTIAVHNGADDNASGTAAMLGAASILVETLKEFSSHRRIVFIAFTGEERGLLGSKYYVDHPLFPNESTVSMINLDMVGRLRDNELTLYGTGSADALVEIIERANARYQFDLFKVETGYGPSDHQSFYKAGVPVIFFFTGLHNDYHRPTDDADKINYASTARITQMVGDVALQLAVRSERPKYAETENRVNIRRQLTAFMGVTLSDQGDHVLLSSISEGGPAAVAGLRSGDRLVNIGKKQIVNSADVLDELRGRSPGQTLKIRILRGGMPLDVNVKLAARPNG